MGRVWHVEFNFPFFFPAQVEVGISVFAVLLIIEVVLLYKLIKKIRV